MISVQIEPADALVSADAKVSPHLNDSLDGVRCGIVPVCDAVEAIAVEIEQSLTGAEPQHSVLLHAG